MRLLPLGSLVLSGGALPALGFLHAQPGFRCIDRRWVIRAEQTSNTPDRRSAILTAVGTFAFFPTFAQVRSICSISSIRSSIRSSSIRSSIRSSSSSSSSSDHFGGLSRMRYNYYLNFDSNSVVVVINALVLAVVTLVAVSWRGYQW